MLRSWFGQSMGWSLAVSCLGALAGAQVPTQWPQRFDPTTAPGATEIAIGRVSDLSAPSCHFGGQASCDGHCAGCDAFLQSSEPIDIEAFSDPFESTDRLTPTGPDALSDPRTLQQPATPSPPTQPTQQPAAPLAPSAGLASTLGAGAGGAGIPGMIGDFFGASSGSWVISFPVSFTARGDIITGTSGDPNALIAYEVGSDQFANDFFSTGTGRDQLSPSPEADTFDVSEPIPPTDAPRPPDPEFGFGGGTARNPTGTFDSGDLWDVTYSYDAEFIVPPSAGLNVGRMKIAENESPIPRDRVFFNYSLFNNAALLANGVDVNRFTPGFEKTFLQGMASLEMRTPFASTLSSDVLVGSGNDLDEVEFGDIYLAAKLLLIERSDYAISCGLTVSIPTADDLNVFSRSGTQLISVHNESIELGPFIGWVTANRGWFTQGFLQVDVDVNGDPVLANQFSPSFEPLGLQHVGQLQQQTLLYFDQQIGRWVYRNHCRRLRGIAMLAEVHYTRSLQESDVVRFGNVRVGQPRDDLQVLSLVAGTTFDLQPSAITLGFATQVGNGSDQQFDGELRVIWNRFF